MSPYDWVDYAACSNVPTELFYEIAMETDALAICYHCPVMAQCQNAAFEEEGAAPYGRYGVRGGMVALDRQRLYRKRTHPLGTHGSTDA